jgi:Na+-driven multidrug efflux pump
MVLSLHMEIQEKDELQPDEREVAIYSKSAVLWFSILFSPIAGGVLLMLNLRSVGNKREGNLIFLISIVYYFLSRILLGYFNKTFSFSNQNLFICTLILDIIGGGILAEYFFKKYFPHDDYEHKSILRPLMIIFLITIPLSILYLNVVHK